ncbi:hypothetical protein KKB18_02620 [bacterium]|nr:hypothetical protein [bacterium]
MAEKLPESKNQKPDDENLVLVTAGYIRELLDNCLIQPKNEDGEFALIFLTALKNNREKELGEDKIRYASLNHRANYYIKNPDMLENN